MRLAYLLFVLTALTILVRIGNPGAETLSLSSETPDESREIPTLGGLTDGALSSLEDARGEVGGPGAPKAPGIVEPRVPPVRAVEEEVTDPAGQGAMSAAESFGERQTAGPSTAPPVFYRLPGSGIGAASRAGSDPVCGDLGGFPESSKVVFPLEREYFYSYEDTWGAARPQGGHEGTDLMTPAGVPEYAVTDGTVVPVAGSNESGWNTLGGYAVMVRADYSIGPVKKGDLFYYAHLERESPLPVGTRVRAGQVIGYSGDTGQGPEGTSGLFPPHLHLGWYDGTGGRSDVDSGAMNPYPLLEWIRSNGGAVTGGSDARYCEALGPPPTNWPDQKDPGVRPDMDTGSDDPSPVVGKEIRKVTGKAGEQTKKPERPNRPDKPREEKRDGDQRKTTDADRSNVQRPEKPERQSSGPNANPPKSEQQSSDQARPDPPAGNLPQPPETPQPPDGDQAEPPCESGASRPGPSSSQYDCASGASPNVPTETSTRPPDEERVPEAGPDQDDEPAE